MRLRTQFASGGARARSEEGALGLTLFPTHEKLEIYRDVYRFDRYRPNNAIPSGHIFNGRSQQRYRTIVNRAPGNLPMRSFAAMRSAVPTHAWI